MSLTGILTSPSATFTALLDDAPAGLEGTIGYTVTDLDGAVITARTTSGIQDLGDGLYCATCTAPAAIGDYLIRWDTGIAEPEFATERLSVRLGVSGTTAYGLYARPSATFEALLDGAATGLAGTIGVKLIDLDGATVIARTTAGITELATSLYRAVLTAPAVEGHYLIRWDTPEEHATESLFVNATGGGPPTASHITPSLEDVGSILRARTRSDDTGAESGTFDTSTRPTASEVLELMEQAEAEVIVRCPSDLSTLSDRLVSFARRMVALRTAMLIELSLYPDQSVESDSIYDKLREDYESLTKTFMQALADGDGANVGGVVMRSVGLTSPNFASETVE